MDSSTWIIFFVPLMIIIIFGEYNRYFTIQRIVKNSKRKRGLVIMNEIIKEFIGKECVITFVYSNITGVIESVDGNWVSIRPKNQGSVTEILNTDHISRIKLHSRSKRGN